MGTTENGKKVKAAGRVTFTAARSQEEMLALVEGNNRIVNLELESNSHVHHLLQFIQLLEVRQAWVLDSLRAGGLVFLRVYTLFPEVSEPVVRDL
jgi:hypothetical protein